MLAIHHSRSSRSTRMVWLCEELRLPYRLEHLRMFSEAMQAPEGLAIHPLGKVPAIEDAGFVLWETTVIMGERAAPSGM